MKALGLRENDQKGLKKTLDGQAFSPNPLATSEVNY